MFRVLIFLELTLFINIIIKNIIKNVVVIKKAVKFREEIWFFNNKCRKLLFFENLIVYEKYNYLFKNKIVKEWK